jgi:hypothetical protein
MPAVFAPTPYLQPTVARREMTCNRWLHVVRRPRIRQAGGSRPRRPRRLRSRDGWEQPGPPRPGRAGQGGPGFWPRAWHGRPYRPLAQRTGADLGRASRFHPQQTRIPARVHDRPDRRVYRHANTDTASATARTVPQGTLAAVSPTAPAATTTTSGTRSFPPGRATSAASSTSTCGRWQPTGGFAETRLVRRTWLPIRVHRRIVGSGYGPGGAQRPAPHGNGAAALVPAPRSAGGNSAPVLDPVCVTVRAFILLDDMNRQSAMPSHFEALLLRPGTDLAAAFATSY